MKDRLYTTTDIISMLPSIGLRYYIDVINDEGDFIEDINSLTWYELINYRDDGFFSNKYILNMSKVYGEDGISILLGVTKDV